MDLTITDTLEGPDPLSVFVGEGGQCLNGNCCPNLNQGKMQVTDFGRLLFKVTQMLIYFSPWVFD